MAGLRSLLPRFVALPLAALFGTATLTFAADSQLSTPSTPPQPAAEQVTQVIIVPDVRRQAYVFAKGTLEDAGFAWRVVGSVHGYAANTVLSQSAAPGAPKEPLDEIPLVDRAKLLAKYVESTPKSAAAVDHFTYQHSWIVTGARFGWWHGAEALEVLIRVDQRVQARWGIGAKSEALARAALAYVK